MVSGFTAEEFEDLCGRTFDRDRDAIAEWFMVHVPGPAVAVQAAVALSTLIGELIPQGLAVHVGPGGFWGLEVDDGAPRHSRVAGQLVTAALNRDQAMTGAIARAAIDGADEEFVALLMVRLTVLLGDVLHALADERRPGPGSRPRR